MVYPTNFEQKTGFDKIRRLVSERCLSPLGEERVAEAVSRAEEAGGGEAQARAQEVCDAGGGKGGGAGIPSGVREEVPGFEEERSLAAEDRQEG